MDSKMGINSKCIHAGMVENEHGAVTPPIYQTSTFRFKSTAHGAALFAGKEKGYVYTRMSNPTIEALEEALADLEGGAKALACASGMAAINTALMALLSQGDHIICSKIVYGPTSTLISTVLTKFGITSSFVNTSDLEEIKKAITEKTKVIYIETPGNPTMDISDLEEIAKIAKENNATLVVDNTFMGPVLQKPLDLGANVVIHSATKSLNGHSDVVAGAIIVKDEEDYPNMKKILNQLGGVINPFNAFLVHRGIKTLSLRMERHSENAEKIAEFLENHPKVKWVRFPGLKSHPQYEIAKKQHKANGGMIAFELSGGYSAGETLMNNVKLCTLGVSLGGVESLIQHPASMTHASMGKQAREEAGITDGLVRLSVGVEDFEDIKEDLEQALNKI